MLVNFRILTGIALTVFSLAASVSGAPVPEDRMKLDKEFAAVATKLLAASWEGGGCDGQITFRADRTYEWTGIGPIGLKDQGTWTLRGDPAKPTLIMRCKTSDDADREGKTVELSLIRVDDKKLVLKYPDEEEPKEYWRADKGVDPRNK